MPLVSRHDLRWSRMRNLPCFTAVLAMVAVSACERADPLQPGPFVPPRLTVAGASLGSMIVPTLPTNDPSARGEIAFQPTGIVIPDSTEVEVRVSGLLRATTNPAWKAAYCDNPDIVGGHPWACSPADRTNFDLYWKGNSDHQLMAKVGVRGADGQVRTFWLSQRAGQDPNIGFVTISVPGQLMVARTGSGLVFGPAQDVYGKTIPAMGALKLASDQQLTAVITADWRQPSLALRCTPARLPRGNSTVCTATAQPTGASFVVQNFSFVGDSGASVAQPGDSKSWTFAPPQSGTITVRATVAGVDRTATTRVEVICNFFKAPTGDSLLDRPEMQDQLRQLWANSNPGDPGPGRIERGMMITMRDGVYTFHPYQGPSTRCSSEAGNMTLQANEIVAIVHTHPDPAGDPWPASCPPQPAGTTVSDKPSGADKVAQKNLSEKVGRPIPSYIVDPSHVHRHGTGVPLLKKDRNQTC
jgi:hypothetical protein